MPEDDDEPEPDLDCWSPAAPTALVLVAEQRDLSAITAAIARGRERPHLLLVDRPRAQAPEPGEAFEIGPLMPLVPYRRVDVNAPARADRAADVEYVVGEPVHWCGLCGQTFRIAPDDPHWATGRGPLCPAPKAKP